MNWQQAAVYIALTIVPTIGIFSMLTACGVFDWVNNKLNGR